MSSNNSNKIMVPNAREAMNKFKMEAANEVGVNLKQLQWRPDQQAGWLPKKTITVKLVYTAF